MTTVQVHSPFPVRSACCETMLRAIGRWFCEPEPQTQVTVSKSVQASTPEGNTIYNDVSHTSVTTDAVTAERLMSEQSRTNLDMMRESLRGVKDIQSNQMLMATPRQQVMAPQQANMGNNQ